MKNTSKLLLVAFMAAPFIANVGLYAPPAVLAAETPATSALTGIKIPRNGQRFEKQNRDFVSFLSALSKEKVVNLSPAGEEAEVFLWSGDNYDKTRIAFVRTMVQKALATAGYTVKEIPYNTLRDVNVYEHFRKEEDKPSFRPANTPDYFQAVNEAQGKALLGTWLDSDESLALGLLPVEFKATAKDKPLPGVAAGGVLIKNFDDTMASLPRTTLPKFPPITRKPGMVRGWLKDSAGRPVAGAEVSVYSSVGGGLRTTHRARSNAQGLYEVMIPTGIAEVAEVDTDVTYNGQKFNLRLDPASGKAKQFNSVDGHVENYVLRAEGKSGGTIRVLDALEKGIVEITLVPVGRLMDGSAGRTLVYRLNKEGARSETFINGMPLGRYKLSARWLDNGEELPLRARLTFGSGANGELKDSLQVDFEPGYTFSQVNSDKSNHDVQFFQVTLEP